MKEQILSMLQGVISALNDIDVRGKQNAGALYGSIDVLEQIGRALQRVELVDAPGASEDQEA